MRRPLSFFWVAALACFLPPVALANGDSQCPPQESTPPGAITGPGDGTGRGTVVTPPSSIEQPGDAGQRAHTTHELFIPLQPSAPGTAEPLGASPPCGGR